MMNTIISDAQTSFGEPKSLHNPTQQACCHSCTVLNLFYFNPCRPPCKGITWALGLSGGGLSASCISVGQCLPELNPLFNNRHSTGLITNSTIIKNIVLSSPSFPLSIDTNI